MKMVTTLNKDSRNSSKHLMRYLSFTFLYLGIILGSSLFSSFAYSAAMSATVDRTVMSEDESIQLTVRLNQQVGYGGPNFELLEHEFDIVNQQRSNQFRSINGRTEAWTEWTIIITPKKSGQLLIPSFEFEDAYSDAIAITVNAIDTSDNNERRDLYATAELNKTEVFVQEQLLVTVKIHTAVDLREIAAANEFAIEDAIIEKVSDNTYRKNIGQRPYRVNEVVYAVYPQKSGELVIPSLSWLAVVANQNNGWDRSPFFSKGTTRRFRTSDRAINVKAQPNNYSGDNWLPAETVTLEQHWSSDPDRFVVGEPITRSITINAKGLTSSQLPPLPEQQVAGIKFYSDQPQFDDIKDNSGVTGYRIENFAIVPSQSGPITLPEMVVTWWDTISNQERTARLPEQTFTVSPAAFNPNNSANAIGNGSDSNLPDTVIGFDYANGSGSDNSGGFFSQFLGRSNFSNTLLIGLLASNLFVAVCALFFLFAWLRLRSQTLEGNRVNHQEHDEYSTKNLNKIFNQFRHACNDNQAAKARDTLIHWAQLYWQLSRPPSLSEIAQNCDSQDISKALEELDKILYGNHGLHSSLSTDEEKPSWSGNTLWKLMVEFKQVNKRQAHNQQQNKSAVKSTTRLSSLYPE